MRFLLMLVGFAWAMTGILNLSVLIINSSESIVLATELIYTFLLFVLPGLGLTGIGNIIGILNKIKENLPKSSTNT